MCYVTILVSYPKNILNSLTLHCTLDCIDLNVLRVFYFKCYWTLFRTMLKESISDSFYNILIDESTDISVLKFLGIIIMYFDKNLKWIISTHLSLVKIGSCDTQTIVINDGGDDWISISTAGDITTTFTILIIHSYVSFVILDNWP